MQSDLIFFTLSGIRNIHRLPFIGRLC